MKTQMLCDIFFIGQYKHSFRLANLCIFLLNKEILKKILQIILSDSTLTFSGLLSCLFYLFLQYLTMISVSALGIDRL
jgi:hypothetical protein